MPNLVPPITTVEAALAYKSRLQAIEPDVTFLMTLYLHPSLTPEMIASAARAGIAGVKAYPAGVTTNSSAGVVDWKTFYPVFGALEQHNLVLNLHGEVPTPKPSDQAPGEVPVNILTAESLFLPTLRQIHAAFPRLRIVLEHCTTAAALDAVAACGSCVAATITSHHLWITINDVAGDVDNFCKPVAKSEHDRRALLKAVVGQYDPRLDGRIMFGSDSAPHAIDKKHVAPGQKSAAGCFTQPYTTQLVIGAVEQALTDGILEGISEEKLVPALRAFLSENARRFYGLEGSTSTHRIVLERRPGVDMMKVVSKPEESDEVVSVFRGGTQTWSLRWAGVGEEIG